MIEWTKVEGKNRDHHVAVYTLSTCGWCKKIKRLLENLEIEYHYVDIDLLKGEEKEEARSEMKKYNPSGSCPTVVVDHGKDHIVGFKEDRVREVLC